MKCDYQFNLSSNYHAHQTGERDFFFLPFGYLLSTDDDTISIVLMIENLFDIRSKIKQQIKERRPS